MSNNKKVSASSGNVFADLGCANPEEELLKAKLVRELRGIIKRRKLTQTKAAVVLGLKQPDVSALVTGRVGKFSIDRLVRCLDRLDYEVDLIVRQKPHRASSRACHEHNYWFIGPFVECMTGKGSAGSYGEAREDHDQELSGVHRRRTRNYRNRSGFHRAVGKE
ncbi:MAG: helix-turn-helix transcriptional regulator [Bradyrhizobium sp.]